MRLIHVVQGQALAETLKSGIAEIVMNSRIEASLSSITYMKRQRIPAQESEGC